MTSCRGAEECNHLVVHGTIGAYSNHRCRCRECREAWATYFRDLRARKRRRLMQGEMQAVEHGRESTYVNWGCRCQRCREAATVARLIRSPAAAD